MKSNPGWSDTAALTQALCEAACDVLSPNSSAHIVPHITRSLTHTPHRPSSSDAEMTDGEIQLNLSLTSNASVFCLH